MTQKEKREFLIQKLIEEQSQYRDLHIPTDEAEQKTLTPGKTYAVDVLIKDLSNIFLHIRKEKDGQKAIAFCSSFGVPCTVAILFQFVVETVLCVAT